MLTRDDVIADIAAAIGYEPADIADDMDLLDQGLDSIRLMGLVEKWRGAGAGDVDYPTLAADPTVAQWVSVVVGPA